MPAKRSYTAAELQARLEQEREQSRLRSARYRLRHRDADAVTVTRHRDAAFNGAPTREGAPARSTSPTEVLRTSVPKKGAGGGHDFERIRELLEPFAGRGYVHDPAFWRCMATSYPDIALEAQAYKMAAWLKKPTQKSQRRECSDTFIVNWLEREQAKAAQPPLQQQAPAVSGPVHPLLEHGARSAVGRVLEMSIEYPPEAPSTWRH